MPQEALQDLAPAPDLESRLLEERTRVAERRAAASEARAALQSLMHEAELRRRRQDALAADIRLWTERAGRAARAFEDLGERLERAQDEHQRLLEAPDTYLHAPPRPHGRSRGRPRRSARKPPTASPMPRRTSPRPTAPPAPPWRRSRPPARPAPARRPATRPPWQRLAEITRTIAENLETTPAGLIELAGLKEATELPPHGEIESKLHSLKSDRERLGAVNLRADEELTELEAKHNGIAGERDDLVEAIKRLRQAIGSLNREGRERLLAAFDVVNDHFQRLFTTLFGGGTAELTLVDSDDPLKRASKSSPARPARSRRA